MRRSEIFDENRLHFRLRDEAGVENPPTDEEWAEVKALFNSPPPKGTGLKFTPKKKKRK